MDQVAGQPEKLALPEPNSGTGGEATTLGGTAFTRVSVADFAHLHEVYAEVLCEAGSQARELRAAGVSERRIALLYPHVSERWAAGCERLSALSLPRNDQGLARLLGRLLMTSSRGELAESCARSRDQRAVQHHPAHLRYVVALLHEVCTSRLAPALLAGGTDYGNSHYVAARVHQLLEHLSQDPRFTPDN